MYISSPSPGLLSDPDIHGRLDRHTKLTSNATLRSASFLPVESSYLEIDRDEFHIKHHQTQLKLYGHSMSSLLRIGMVGGSSEARMEVVKPNGDNPFGMSDQDDFLLETCISDDRLVLFTTDIPILAMEYLPLPNSASPQLAYDLKAFYRNDLQCNSAIISPSDVDSDSVDEFRVCEFSSLCLGYFRDGNRKYHQIKALLEAEKNKWTSGQTKHIAEALKPISYGLTGLTGEPELSDGATYWQKTWGAIRNNTARALTKAMVSALEVDLKAYEIWDHSADFFLAWIRHTVCEHLKLRIPLSEAATQFQKNKLEDVLKVVRLKLGVIELENSLQSRSLASKPSTPSSSSGKVNGVVSMIERTNIDTGTLAKAKPRK